MAGNRSFKTYTFASGSTDPTVTIPVPEGGASGSFSLYARRTAGAGTATLAVDGSFKSAPTTNDRFVVQAATSVGTGALTNILGTSEEDRFPYLVLTLDRTGTSTVVVYMTFF